MAKARIVGMEIYQTQLEHLANEIRSINRGALGSAAGYVADQVKTALESMPVHDDDEWGTDDYKLYGATESEKSQIIQNFGIARFTEGVGSTETAVGFTGYVETPSNRFNGHVPTGMLMQCIDYGTSFRLPTHTVSRVVNRLKNEVAQKAQDYIDKETQKIMK